MYRACGRFAFVLAVLLFNACGSARQEAGLKINYVETGIVVTSPSGENIPAKTGDVVPVGSTVTAKSGAVDIGLDEAAAVRLLSGTAVRAKRAGDEIDLKLDEGTLLVNIKALDNRPAAKFRVTTPSGVCGTRGTAFYVKNTGDEMDVGVENGEVYLRGAAGGEVNIPAGHKAVAKLTAPVTDIDKLLESEREILTQVNLLNFHVVVGSVRKTVAAVDVKAIEAGLEIYRATHEKYPDQIGDAVTGTKDPWGNPFNYIPTADRADYQLSSSGPDGKVNTADDIRLR